MVRTVIHAICAMILSGTLIISIPTLSILLGETFTPRKRNKVRTTEIERIEMSVPRPEQKKIRKKPRRRKTPRQSGKSGPRFAMDLGAKGMGGVAVSDEMINRSTGSGGNTDEGVDERPQLVGNIDIQIPDAVREAERNASVRLLFCVDVAGRPYDIRISEEDPPGLGLADAGVQALKQVTFRPAVKDGQSVPFCGMEQPIEIKFRN
jgi:protein TonB